MKDHFSKYIYAKDKTLNIYVSSVNLQILWIGIIMKNNEDRTMKKKCKKRVFRELSLGHKNTYNLLQKQFAL